MTDKSERLSIIKDEYKRVCDDIRSLETSGAQVLNIGLSALVATIVVGQEKIPLAIYMFLPVLATIVIVYGSMLNSWIFIAGGYKYYLEKTINNAVGDAVLIWEHTVDVRIKHAWPSKFLGLLHIATWIFICAYSTLHVLMTCCTLGLITVGICVVLGCGLGFMNVSAKDLHAISYDAALRRSVIEGERIRDGRG